jgi:glycosyltransferase involved in cell wall biosynthesis
VRIGWISDCLPYLPSRGGFRLYGGNLIRVLSARHRIDLLSFLREDDAAHLDWPRQYCATLTTITIERPGLAPRVANALSSYLWGNQLHHRRRFQGALREGLESRRWDVLHFEGPFSAGLLPRGLPVPRVLSMHDSWTLRCREMLQCPHSWRQKTFYTVLTYHEPRYERLVYPRFDRCTVVAAPDLEEVRRVVPNCKAELIPYGTDTKYFHPVAVQKEPHTLVFHSHLGYPPNIEAALEFAKDIFPRIRKECPDAVFHLVGASPVEKVRQLASRPGIRISVDLLDLRAAVCSAGVYVCAIRHGTGLKSKVLEAMAMRMPIVAYHPGSTVGIDCVYGQHLLAAETPEQFAGHVLDLLSHPEKADRIAQAGRELVEEKYSWESRGRAYEQLYQRIIEERQAAPARLRLSSRWLVGLPRM